MDILPQIPEHIGTAAEFLTIIFSAIGAAVALHHAKFFRGQESTLVARLKDVFFTDALVYLITLVMGVGLYWNLNLLVKYDILIRPLVLLMNIIATIRLYKHYKQVK